jgi:cytochrome c oxidase subunit II
MTPGSMSHSAFNPAGLQAARIARLTWILLGTTAVVFVIVLAVLAWAVVIGTRRQEQPSLNPPPSNVGLTGAVSAAGVVTVFIIVTLMGASIWTDHVLASLHAQNALTIAVTGHQWWWELQYENNTPSLRVETANEVHIPTGQPVLLKLASADVIHSFWAPSLHGKRDLIPGYTTTVWIQADQPGIFRGQCAEFCGRQHAHMAFSVVSEGQDEFNHWLDTQRATPPPPVTDLERRGQQVFMSYTCAACHTIQGTDAHGRVGPVLSHIASRGTIGADSLTATHRGLASFIRNPQAVKPGNYMPPNTLSTDDINALVAYLQSLQ